MAGLREGISEYGAAARHEHIRLARKPRNRRTCHQLERRIGGERVARERNAEHPAACIGNGRCARFHADAPEQPLRTEGGHNAVHDILLAHGNSPRREKEIHAIRIGGDHLRRTFHIIGHRADHRHLCAELFQPSRKEVEIAVVDLAGAQRLAGLQQLIACARHSDAHAPMDAHIRMSLTREYRDLRRADALSLREEQRILLDVLARIAVVLKWLRGKGNEDRSPLLAHIFLPHHAITARRNRAARHDADTLPRTDRAGEEIARALLADHRQAYGVLCRSILRARRREGIAVER